MSDMAVDHHVASPEFRLGPGDAAVMDRAIPRPAPCSPVGALAEEHVRDYLERFGLLRDEAARRHYRETHFGDLVGRAYPRAGVEAMTLIGEWMAVWAMFDDYLERIVDSAGLPEVDGVIAQVSAIFDWDGRAAAGAAAVDLGNPLIAALRDMWERMLPATSPPWQARFARDIRGYLGGCRWEAGNRIAGRVPPVARYIEMRRRFGGMRPSMTLAELGGQYDLGEAVRGSIRILELIDVTADLVLWVNDLYSAAAEREDGNLHNIVWTVAHEHAVGFREALRTCLDWIELRGHDMRRLEQRWRTRAVREGFTPAQVELGARHIEDMWAWVRGNFDWSAGNERYRTARDRTGGRQVNYLLEGG